jgi:hypothetical protein
MNTILYKRLFEIRILHDYYLSKADLTSFYALNNNEKTEFLKFSISRDEYDVRNYLDIIPTESTRTVFNNFHLRMAIIPSGFIVGVKVKSRLNETGEVEYLPTSLTPADALHLGFFLRITDPEFTTYTNLKIQNSAPFRYFFSNTNTDGGKIFPSLSVPVADFVAGKTYEPGEMAIVGGILKEALEETTSNNAAVWRAVAGNVFANQQDRILLPKLFPYTLSEASNTTEFTLKEEDGTDIKKVTFNTARNFQTIYLDFRQAALATDNVPEDIVDGRYLLEISTDSSTKTVPVYLSNELYRRSDAGALLIETDVTDPDFRLMNDSGALITRKNADGSFVPHPVFEIRFKRRSTYWRYRSDTGGKLKAEALTQPFLDEVGNDLITKDLRPLSYYPTFFANPPQQDIYLPNPKTNSVKKETKKYFSDTYVSPINGLIELE